MPMPTWLDQHVEEFVKPHLGSVPNFPDQADKYAFYYKNFNSEVIKNLQACWEAGKKKAKGKPILLAGRDVWLFEVLARLEGWPTIFRPEISSGVCNAKSLKGKFNQCHLIDTGHRGTVPKALGMKNWDLIYYSTPSGYKGDERKKMLQDHQLFPEIDAGNEPIYNVYSLLEGHPKYWQAGYIDTSGQVRQYIDLPQYNTHNKNYYVNKNFEQCALVTMHVVKNLTTLKVVKYFIMKGLKNGKAEV